MDFVGVSPFTVFDPVDAKRDLLLFDRLAVPGLRALFDCVHYGLSERADLEWLCGQGLVSEARLDTDKATLYRLLKAADDVAGQPNIFTRLVAQSLRSKGIDAVPLESSEVLRVRRVEIDGVDFDETHRPRYSVSAYCLDDTSLFRWG